MVPSNRLGDVSGNPAVLPEKHFVSPKAPGGVVKLRAQVPKDVSFDELYTFAFQARLTML